ncbi:MAG: TetR/AcrR family transcriptional regulator [Ottowia sp.]|uniref:TetR/AcrR family transcriptional regulator n=1 Tax=unclassified Ottowia TaxID=2645081 RepID=UPI003C2D143D
MSKPTSSTTPISKDIQTSERILLAAEKLFAEKGIGAVSLRSIMAEAQSNTASAHYYFRSKEGVLKAIFTKHGAAMNAERNALLDACEKKPGEGIAAIRRLIEAFIGPAIRLRESADGRNFDRISALCSVDPTPGVREIVFETFDAVGKRFSGLLRAACPHLTNEEYYWRLHCLFGCMMYVRGHNGRVDQLVPSDPASASAALVLDQLTTFIAAGMKSPSRMPE